MPEVLDHAANEASRRGHQFIVEGVTDFDVLLRVLGIFAILRAGLHSVQMTQSGAAARVRICVHGFDDDKAQILRAKIQGLPCVSLVSYHALGHSPDVTFNAG
ncbi:MAG: hypothetical protein WA840_15195 [Caulobacteraceae bacterium]